MKTIVDRRAPDLSAYPDMVVIYLGMRINKLRGLKRLFGLGPEIRLAGELKPDGLLHFDNNILFSLFPLHVGMRWYWRDFDALERWARTDLHRKWWQEFVRDAGGTGFWHEAYFMRGGMEAVFDDLNGQRFGLAAFAPMNEARGSMFSARTRNGMGNSGVPLPDGTAEHDLY